MTQFTPPVVKEEPRPQTITVVPPNSTWPTAVTFCTFLICITALLVHWT